MGLTVSQIVSEFGAYYDPTGQNESNIHTTMLEKRQFDSVATTVSHDGDIYRMGEATVDDVVQTFKGQFSSKGTATFKPADIQLRRQKIDFDMYPDDIVKTWLGFFAKLSEADRSQWPFVRYLWEKVISPKWGANMSYIDWAGSYIAPTNDAAAGPTLGSYDGLKKLAKAGINGVPTMHLMTSDGNSVSSTDKVFDAFEVFADQLPAMWEGEDVVFLCSPRTELRYFRDKRNQHGSDTKNTTEAMYKTIDGRSTWSIVPMHGMGKANDHEWVIATLRSNLLRAERPNATAFRMETAKRQVSIMAEWQEGIGFGNDDEVYVHTGEDLSSGD